MTADKARLPVDIDAEPLVRAAAALRPAIRRWHEEIEREQRLPPPLVAELRAAGCYRMVIPRSLGGLEVDPLTYLRVVELLAEGAGSVGWNLANNSIGQLVTLGLPEEGVQEIYGGGPAIIAGTAVQGGGRGGAGRWRLPRHRALALWHRLPRKRLDAGQLPGARRRRPAAPPPGRHAALLARSIRAVRGGGRAGKLGRRRAARHRQLRLDGRGCLPAGAADGAARGAPLDNQWQRWPGVTYALPSQCWVGPHHSAVITGIARAGIDALIELAGEKTPRGRGPGLLCEDPQVQEAVGRADAILNAGRAYRSAMIAELWNTVARGVETTLEQRARCRLASTYAADSAREAMDLVYRHGGSTSFRRDSRLAECWRDLHVVGQTVTIAPEWYPIGGRVYLGMDPGPRLR